MKIRLDQLSEENFGDYESLTSCESSGGCYCAFWHQKITSMSEWDKRKSEQPQLNRQIVLDKVKTGFHVGALAYANDELLAWISVGPLTDCYWTWKRMIQVREESRSVAAITCLTVAPKFRGKGFQCAILNQLKIYGRQKGWKIIEGYPFDNSTIEKQKESVLWPGLPKGFESAGFERVGPHWLSGADWERSIYRCTLN